MTKSMIRALALVGSSILLATTGQATTAGGSMAVKATVQSSCSVSAVALDFGTVTLLGAGNQDNQSTLKVTCTSGTGYNVGLDAGLNGVDTTHRSMTSGSNSLNYALYIDSNRTQNWGNTAPPDSTDTAVGTGNGTEQDLTVYGRIPGGQNVAPGLYTDTVTVSVYY